MTPIALLAELSLAFVGGFLGACVSALGGFLLFGLAGMAGFLCLLWAGSDALLVSPVTGIVLKPSVCFLGGVVAAAYARKLGLVRCGKDIGRPLVTFRRFDVVLVGGLAGIAGHGVNRLLDRAIGWGVDTVALTVFAVALALKYAWGLTKTSDCDAVSHAVPSPYRFFERLSHPAGKTVISLFVGLMSAWLVWLLSLDPSTAPFAGLPAFCLSALSLSLVFMSVPVPATHHYSGPAGLVAVGWLAIHDGGPTDGSAMLLLMLWGGAAAQLTMLFAETMRKLFFDEGDIHVDPPAMGIMLASALIMGILPATGVYNAEHSTQILVCAGVIVACTAVNIGMLRRRPVA